MTRDDTKDIKIGSKVYIWGNKEKPQKVIWRGLGTLGTGSPRDIRFETGMYFSLNDPSQIEFAPDDVETEQLDKSLIVVIIQNGNSKTDFFEVKVPSSNNFNERSFYFISNGISADPNGHLVTYNEQFINSAKNK